MEHDKPTRCHWVRHSDGVDVLIPMCWGAVHDPSECTCVTDGSRLERAEIAREIAEGEVLRLRNKLLGQADRYAATLRHQEGLYAEIRRLRAAEALRQKDGG